jgi:hypothetical protein
MMAEARYKVRVKNLPKIRWIDPGSEKFDKTKGFPAYAPSWMGPLDRRIPRSHRLHRYQVKCPPSSFLIVRSSPAPGGLLMPLRASSSVPFFVL